MVWFIVCLGVVIAAFVMWDHINPELPEILQLPNKGTATAGVSGESPEAALAHGIGPERWTITNDGRNVRASREFRSPIVAGASRYYPPKLHFSCYEHELYAWLETGLQAKESTHGLVSVRLNNGKPEMWNKGEGTTVASGTPARVLDAVATGKPLSITMAFLEAPEQTLTLQTDDSDELVAYLRHCKQ